MLTCRCVWVNGPVIVGAGPSGLAVAAGLRDHGVPFAILEKSDCIASLWKNRTYDRLKLHLPKQFCQLPNFPMPEYFPKYPSKRQFIEYLESYASRFQIRPKFNECVRYAKYDDGCRLWRVRCDAGDGSEAVEYICQWLVVATGENAERVVPEIEGLKDFQGEVIHAGDYKCGEGFRGKKVLVVGCGNSGMEISLDLCNYDAKPQMVVRSAVHVLPREVMGKSTFELAMLMLKWLPLWLVDKILLFLAWMVLGNTDDYGIKRPDAGPLELKNSRGKTPVLDTGAIEKIRAGEIRVLPEVKRFSGGSTAQLVNDERVEFDAVILATGYKSNVPCWLEESDLFCKNGFHKTTFRNGWKGKKGLYAVGFTRRGLVGASVDAVRISRDIARIWKDEIKQRGHNNHIRCISTL